MKSNRQIFAPIIAEVLAQNAGQPWPVVRKALREAFPRGPRKYWPYKVWLDEIRRQRRRPVQREMPLFDGLAAEGSMP